MASDYIQDFAFRQISQAIMATANSVANAAPSSSGDGESSIFDVVRRKLGKMQDAIQGFTAPLKRRSMYEELPEHVWPKEQIEMSRMVQSGLGHNFLPCHLSNPTWCDYCGDFIWGLFKQCLRCQTCQYTCHQHCVPAVTLNCKSICDDGFGAATAAKTPSPSDPRSHLETSLSISNISRLPGCARIVPDLSNNTPNAGTQQAQRISDSVPDYQYKVQGRSGSVCGASPIVYSDPSQEYTGTSRATRVPTNHQLSRSASEGFVTVHSPLAPQPVLSSNPTPHSSQGQHISPPPQPSPPYPSTNSRPSSLQRTHTKTHSHIKTALQDEDLPSAAASDKATQGNNNATDSTGCIEQHPTISQDTASELHDLDVNHESTTEKDETDSGYRSGTIPEDKLPRAPSQATLDRQELSRKIAKYNHLVPAATLEVSENESFQGFVKVTMNLIRPITMELGARPPSIYELLTREHIVEENTQHVAFYMPRDTHKSLHISSDTTTKEVVTSLLKKFHILDHPRKFAMYEQEFNDRNKLVRLRRLTDKDFPLRAILGWDPERIKNYRMVLQENETGEIVWDVFSLPELGNFLKVLDREEKETILELKHKYAYMKQYMERRLTELRSERNKQC